MLTLRKKKAYLVVFCLKFNEIKFCTVLMNWLIREKLFAYFYNKFRPVNCIYCIKCGVNSSLHNSDCCIRSMAHWTTVLSQHTEFTKRVIYYKFTFVWYSTKQGTTHTPMSHLAHCALSSTVRTQTAGLILLAIVCYGYFCWGWLLLFLFFLKIVF